MCSSVSQKLRGLSGDKKMHRRNLLHIFWKECHGLATGYDTGLGAEDAVPHQWVMIFILLFPTSGGEAGDERQIQSGWRLRKSDN